MSDPTQVLFGKEHVERYLATDGKEGHEWRGTVCLLLFTKGRTSGKEYIHPLIYQEVDGKYAIVASKGGAPKPPEWYLNLHANPDDVEIQVLGDRFKVRPHDAGPDEKPALWKVMTQAWPDYDDYQTKTDREIPVVVLERA
ncbi:MAG: nitroreductase family deazaflavin-dependent oxidoreductase [Jatrophihabitans sp.]|uniref:nitroreductase family deazaflavin-dependent oxidoreductase n=1 Tax=Jatrophihabitans sp. TaxID=1932789 RepID=UPI003F819C80